MIIVSVNCKSSSIRKEANPNSGIKNNIVRIIKKETTEITKELSNQSLDSKKPWYNTWWAILLNIILLIPFSAITALLGFIALFLRLSKLKNFWKWFLIISGIAGTILIILAINVINELG